MLFFIFDPVVPEPSFDQRFAQRHLTFRATARRFEMVVDRDTESSMTTADQVDVMIHRFEFFDQRIIETILELFT